MGKESRMLVQVLIMVLLIAVMTAGCDYNRPEEEKIGSVLEGISVSDAVLSGAKTLVAGYYEMDSLIFPDYQYSNWRIQSLEWAYAYDDPTLDIYRINYEFLSEAPENVVLAGGMYVTDDNWVCPTYPNCTYLVFDALEETFLFAMMENDCFPGDQLFTADVNRRWLRFTSLPVDLEELVVSDLTSDTIVGVGVFMDYADDNIVVFHGYFGLFAYDLNEREIILSVDLEKSVGTRNIQGSELAIVRVSADGTLIQLYYQSESSVPENAYYIYTSDLSCLYGKYRELDGYFRIDDYNCVEFEDGTRGEIVDQGPLDTISHLKYCRGEEVYMLFETGG